VFYRGGRKVFGAYLDEQFDGIAPLNLTSDSKPAQIIPAGKYICAYHTGHYTTIEETFEKIKKRYAHLHLADEWITINIIDQFVDNNRDNYITGVQIQIL
jgi:effector-binding domain-containing protein